MTPEKHTVGLVHTGTFRHCGSMHKTFTGSSQTKSQPIREVAIESLTKKFIVIDIFWER